MVLCANPQVQAFGLSLPKAWLAKIRRVANRSGKLHLAVAVSPTVVAHPASPHHDFLACALYLVDPTQVEEAEAYNWEGVLQPELVVRPHVPECLLQGRFDQRGLVLGLQRTIWGVLPVENAARGEKVDEVLPATPSCLVQGRPSRVIHPPRINSVRQK